MRPLSHAPIRRFSVLVATLPMLLGSAACGAVTSGSPEVTAPETNARASVNDRHVLLISLDGFNPKSLALLGQKQTPSLHKIIRRGATTLNARTLRERTQTLPNHTGMITGRRVDPAEGGHGVWFNTDPGTTVSDAAGEPVASVFDAVHRAGGTTALFTSKDKFRYFQRSWPDTIDRFTYQTDNAKLMKSTLKDLKTRRAFTMLHLSAPDAAGHRYGFLSPAYLRVVKRVDALIGKLLAKLRKRPELAEGLVVLVTADHGGPRNHKLHSKVNLRANYRVPLLAWGDGVARGDLYRLNPGFRDPGTKRTGYAGTQPIRNGMVANLSTSLLGLDAVPGSTLDPAQQLDVLR